MKPVLTSWLPKVKSWAQSRCRKSWISTEVLMSTNRLDQTSTTDVPEDDVWKKLAERRDVLEMCIEEEVPFADRAERLLEQLEEEGH